jgi:hypothetical protein
VTNVLIGALLEPENAFTPEDMLGELVIEKVLKSSDQERAIALKSECVKTVSR